MASAPLELAWLYHEFCKFLIDIRRFDLARFYAKKGHDMAYKANSNQWVLNIDHLMLRMEIYQNNRNEARDAAILALAHAKELNIDCLVKIKFTTSQIYSYIAPPFCGRIYIMIDMHPLFKISSQRAGENAFKKYWKTTNGTNSLVAASNSH